MMVIGAGRINPAYVFIPSIRATGLIGGDGLPRIFCPYRGALRAARWTLLSAEYRDGSSMTLGPNPVLLPSRRLAIGVSLQLFRQRPKRGRDAHPQPQLWGSPSRDSEQLRDKSEIRSTAKGAVAGERGPLAFRWLVGAPLD